MSLHLQVVCWPLQSPNTVLLTPRLLQLFGLLNIFEISSLAILLLAIQITLQSLYPSMVKSLQDLLLDGILLSNSMNQHLSICPANPTQLQMLYPAIFKLVQSTRLLTFPYQNFTVLNAKTSYDLKSSMPLNLTMTPLNHTWQYLSSFTLKKYVLYRTRTVGKTKVTQLVIPSSLVETTLKLLHDAPSVVYPGRDKTLSMARANYYWPTLRLDIEKHIVRCLSCSEKKGTTKTAQILEYLLPAGPFDVIGIDLLQLPGIHQCSSYVLVCVDHFSRFTVLAPLPNKYATTVAHALISHLICLYTTPRVLLNDNGTDFKNQTLQYICNQFSIKQTCAGRSGHLC